MWFDKKNTEQASRKPKEFSHAELTFNEPSDGE